MIKIVYKKPNEKPCEMEVENTLEKFQELVNGYIDVLPANKDSSILMIVNEEGKSLNLEENIYIGETPVVGNVIFAQSGHDEEFHSLTDDMIESIIKTLS